MPVQLTPEAIAADKKAREQMAYGPIDQNAVRYAKFCARDRIANGALSYRNEFEACLCCDAFFNKSTINIANRLAMDWIKFCMDQTQTKENQFAVAVENGAEKFIFANVKPFLGSAIRRFEFEISSEELDADRFAFSVKLPVTFLSEMGPEFPLENGFVDAFLDVLVSDTRSIMERVVDRAMAPMSGHEAAAMLSRFADLFGDIGFDRIAGVCNDYADGCRSDEDPETDHIAEISGILSDLRQKARDLDIEPAFEYIAAALPAKRIRTKYAR